MPSNSKTRKPYKKKPILLNPMGFVKEGMSTLATWDFGKQYKILLTRTYSALTAIKEGQGEQGHAAMLLGMLEVSEVLLYKHGFGTEYLPVVQKGGRVIRDLLWRAESANRFLFSGEELQAVAELLEFHEAQLGICTVNDIDKVLLFLRKNKSVPPWLVKPT